MLYVQYSILKNRYFRAHPENLLLTILFDTSTIVTVKFSISNKFCTFIILTFNF